MAKKRTDEFNRCGNDAGAKRSEYRALNLQEQKITTRIARWRLKRGPTQPSRSTLCWGPKHTALNAIILLVLARLPNASGCPLKSLPPLFGDGSRIELRLVATTIPAHLSQICQQPVDCQFSLLPNGHSKGRDQNRKKHGKDPGHRQRCRGAALFAP